MGNLQPDKPSIDFDRSPVPGVPVEVVRYVLTLPEEVRQWLGNFLLDSTIEGFDGTPETSAHLWRDELRRRIEHAEAHPETCTPADQFLRELRERIEQLQRTPHPDHLHGYHCVEYFGDGWAEKGHSDPTREITVAPLGEIPPALRLGFFPIGRVGPDGAAVGYLYGRRGLWVFDPVTEGFTLLTPKLADLTGTRRPG